ncbi:hypothetical protein UFOVP577_19 [uncultured Caudovirales phage]|jgi:hypothetical protein|uniref:Uncharacterized protein n=1 Tax=uncultured Caudovirales phage TaxID=2100421 RepID=A0A6J5N099_9CAUD|nr:hypothetical protein UFOVP577_19 [uncultured Caudovirales phage]
MDIQIKWFNERFNIGLASKEGAEPFITIKGCRVKQFDNREFISFPAFKLETGKWVNHVWANDAFQEAVIKKVKETMPKERRGNNMNDLENDIPF